MPTVNIFCRASASASAIPESERALLSWSRRTSHLCLSVGPDRSPVQAAEVSLGGAWVEVSLGEALAEIARREPREGVPSLFVRDLGGEERGFIPWWESSIAD